MFRFFDGLKKSEPRLRWDRLVALHLLLLAFINSFGYDMQESTPQQFIDVALQANNSQILRNLAAWLPKFGLRRNRAAKLIADAIQRVRLQRDFGGLASSWEDDPGFDAAIPEQDTIWQAHEDVESGGVSEEAKS